MLNFFKKFNFKIIIFFFIIFFSFYRSPYIFLNGRFFAEESIHFAYAWKNGFLNGLFFIEAYAGYFNFIANILASFASLIKIEQAAFVNIYGSFFTIILLPYLILFRDSILFFNDKKKVLGSLLLFCSPPFTPEIWINSVNLQIYLCLIVIVILFMKNLNKKQKILNHSIILISGLSGIYSCILLPLFSLKYLKKKNFYNLFNLIIISFTTLIQFLLIIFFKTQNTLHDSVLKFNLDFSGIHLFFYNNILKPFFNRQIIYLIWEKFSIVFPLINYFIFIMICILILFVILIKKYQNILEWLREDNVSIFLIYIFFTVSIIITFGSLGNYYGGRYSVITGVTLILLTFHVYSKVEQKFFKGTLLVLIISALTSGFYQFRPSSNDFKYQYINILDCNNCPVWKEEVNN